MAFALELSPPGRSVLPLPPSLPPSMPEFAPNQQIWMKSIPRDTLAWEAERNGFAQIWDGSGNEFVKQKKD